MKRHAIFKYHGLGNDFVVVEADQWSAAPEFARELCDRHRGVGADGLLMVEPLDPREDGAHARMTIFNRDGSRPEMCGNGIRCVARHLGEEAGLSDDPLVIQSDAGKRRCRIVDSQPGPWQVEVDMGRADVAARAHVLSVGDYSAEATLVDMGNPHAVVFDRPSTATIDRVGRALNDAHPDFEEGVNVEFVEVVDARSLDVVVYERGVGRTLACGTGACAAAVAAAERDVGAGDGTIEVELPGGALRIRREADTVWMTGPVERVYRAELSDDWIAARAEVASTGQTE